VRPLCACSELPAPPERVVSLENHSTQQQRRRGWKAFDEQNTSALKSAKIHRQLASGWGGGGVGRSRSWTRSRRRPNCCFGAPSSVDKFWFGEIATAGRFSGSACTGVHRAREGRVRRSRTRWCAIFFEQSRGAIRGDAGWYGRSSRVPKRTVITGDCTLERALAAGHAFHGRCLGAQLWRVAVAVSAT